MGAKVVRPVRSWAGRPGTPQAFLPRLQMSPRPSSKKPLSNYPPSISTRSIHCMYPNHSCLRRLLHSSSSHPGPMQPFAQTYTRLLPLLTPPLPSTQVSHPHSTCHQDGCGCTRDGVHRASNPSNYISCAAASTGMWWMPRWMKTRGGTSRGCKSRR